MRLMCKILLTLSTFFILTNLHAEKGQVKSPSTPWELLFGDTRVENMESGRTAAVLKSSHLQSKDCPNLEKIEFQLDFDAGKTAQLTIILSDIKSQQVTFVIESFDHDYGHEPYRVELVTDHRDVYGDGLYQKERLLLSEKTSYWSGQNFIRVNYSNLVTETYVNMWDGADRVKTLKNLSCTYDI